MNNHSYVGLQRGPTYFRLILEPKICLDREDHGTGWNLPRHNMMSGCLK